MSCLFFNLGWFSHTDKFQHKKYSSSSQYCILHSVIQTTEFLSEGTKLEITSANETPTDEHEEEEELKDIELRQFYTTKETNFVSTDSRQER